MQIRGQELRGQEWTWYHNELVELSVWMVRRPFRRLRISKKFDSYQLNGLQCIWYASCFWQSTYLHFSEISLSGLQRMWYASCFWQSTYLVFSEISITVELHNDLLFLSPHFGDVWDPTRLSPSVTLTSRIRAWLFTTRSVKGLLHRTIRCVLVLVLIDFAQSYQEWNTVRYIVLFFTSCF